MAMGALDTLLTMPVRLDILQSLTPIFQVLRPSFIQHCSAERGELPSMQSPLTVRLTRTPAVSLTTHGTTMPKRFLSPLRPERFSPHGRTETQVLSQKYLLQADHSCTPLS